jgi:putative hydrolase of the HAD superfamily
VAVLSNNSTLMAERWIDIVPALFPLFANRAFCSGSLGAPKPAPAVYRRCLDALAVAPRETLFVDDNAANVDGARAAGLRGHCFLSQAELAEALVRLGLG